MADTDEEINKGIKLKKDRYRNIRGGEAHLLDIFCVKCNNLLMKYQKDGRGNLIRCYLNRVMFPPNLENLQYNFSLQNVKDLPNLECSQCKTVIGTKMVYDDGRPAFRLIRGSYYKRILL